MSGYHGRFDPAEFNVPPEIGKGKSSRIQAYIQSGHDRALSIIARSGVFPFEREQDVIRYCIWFGLTHLDKLEPTLINSVMRRANMMIYDNREEIERQKFLEWLETQKQAVQGHLGRGDEASAREVVARNYKQILSMPDEPEREERWKHKYLNQLEMDFKAYIPYEDTDKAA
jgi:hypothetical protein